MEDHNLKYPVILYVYGGPGNQMVTNSYIDHHNICDIFCSQEYVLVIVDGRGSGNRGLTFEQFIYGSLGTVELDDQIKALLFLNQEVDFLDLSRVAICGFSYGGYLALMALIKYPNFFKVGLAVSPVTCWMNYNAIYTERYLGVMSKELYFESSPLKFTDKFPDQDGRLFISHGLVDDNVHFRHAADLASLLNIYCKPYYFNIRPKDGHSLGSLLHFFTTVLNFLDSNI